MHNKPVATLLIWDGQSYEYSHGIFFKVGQKSRKTTKRCDTVSSDRWKFILLERHQPDVIAHSVGVIYQFMYQPYEGHTLSYSETNTPLCKRHSNLWFDVEAICKVFFEWFCGCRGDRVSRRSTIRFSLQLAPLQFHCVVKSKAQLLFLGMKLNTWQLQRLLKNVYG